MKRFVVDASALLAGVAGRSEGTPALILGALLDAKFEAVVCPRRKSLDLIEASETAEPHG